VNRKQRGGKRRDPFPNKGRRKKKGRSNYYDKYFKMSVIEHDDCCQLKLYPWPVKG